MAATPLVYITRLALSLLRLPAPDMQLSLLLLLLLQLLVVLPLVQATHSTCSWVPPVSKGKSPKYSAYTLWCTAGLMRTDDTKGRYLCENNSCKQIADWNVLGPGILEWGTPCGGGGYGFNMLGVCVSRFWALCIGDSEKGNCFHMIDSDDCQWPHTFPFAEVPQKLELWAYILPDRKQQL